jgi:bacillithiol biosynthesis cysteine-adding enzyme BshC
MIQKISLEKTQAFSKTFLDYMAGAPALDEFYGYKPLIENFSKQIADKNFSSEKRTVLVDALKQQYHSFSVTPLVQANIEALQDAKTFTVTTGHQLNIFGGPLYLIYKIITTIRMAQQLADRYPEYRFVPVFWMASEDHDFEEINHFNLFGKKWSWETTQRGAVGRFALHGMETLLDSLPEKIALFEAAYRSERTLAEATRYYVNELFGKDGLVILDADQPSLKKLFAPVVEEELLQQQVHELVEKTSNALVQKGYDAQIHARPINLFYLQNQSRERIIKDGEIYKINNTERTFSEEEILEQVRLHPENFSPNVVLRPLYQEIILPNLAYIGGPAEVIYWLQLKTVFEKHQETFPILIPRNFGLVVNKANQNRMEKLGLSITELFDPEDKLKNNYLLKITQAEFKLEQERAAIQTLFAGIKDKAGSIDKTMESVVMADQQKVFKVLEDLEKRLKKAEERKNDTVLTQVLNLKAKLFPNGTLQERSYNFLNFQINDPDFIEKLKGAFEPFDYSFYIIGEHA